MGPSQHSAQVSAELHSLSVFLPRTAEVSNRGVANETASAPIGRQHGFSKKNGKKVFSEQLASKWQNLKALIEQRDSVQHHWRERRTPLRLCRRPREPPLQAAAVNVVRRYQCCPSRSSLLFL